MKCAECGNDYQEIFSLPTKLWKKIWPNSGTLCFNCCDKIARKNGIELFWTGDYRRYRRAPSRDYTTDEIIEMLQISKNTLYCYHYKYKLAYQKTPGGILYWTEEDVEKITAMHQRRGRPRKK